MTIDSMIADVIGREGKYSNDPKDRGGPTIWGITQQVARAYGYAGDMKTMPRDTAIAIYRRRYWSAVGFDKIGAVAPALGAELFDCGVNMGPATAGKILQRSLNLLNREASDYPDIVVDGGVGAMTVASLMGYLKARPGAQGLAVLLWLFRSLRTGRYADIAEADPTQERFEYGWIVRQIGLAA